MVLAVTVPWLVYNDTGILTISRTEMSGLTVSARDSLRQRQHTVHVVQTALPWVSGVLVLLGLGLLVWGAIRMKEAQGWEDREQQARTKQHEATVESLTPQERSERLQEAAAEQTLVESQAAVKQGVASDEGERVRVDPRQQRPPESSASEMRRVEDAVLARVSELLPPGYRLEAQVKVQSSQDLAVYLDGLIEASVADEPDVIVEVKVRTRAYGFASRRDADQLLGAMSRYEAITGKHCVGWLILVFNGDKDSWQPFREAAVKGLERALHPRARASVVDYADLESLVLPIIGPAGLSSVIG